MMACLCLSRTVLYRAIVSAPVRARRLVAAALCSLTFAAAVQAQEVTVTLVPTSTLTGAQGEKITFRATVRNGAPSARYLNQLSVTVQGTDQLAGDPSPFYSSFAGQLAAGAQLADKPFFSIEIEKTAPTNTYTGTVAILGGATEADADSLAQVDFTVKVDPASAGAPDTSITQGPPDLGKACETSVPFAWTGTDNLTEPAALTYAYKLDINDWSAYSADTVHLFENLSEGLHTVQVRAKDGDGNVDPTPAGRQFYVDLTAPMLSNITGDIRDFRATIAWTTSEPSTGEVEYGETDQYGSTTGVDGSMAGAHRMVLANLKPLTTYHYRLKSGDGCRTTLSEDRTFTTTDILKPDLSLVEIKTPPDAGTLQHIEIKWRVQNVERGDAAAPWTDTVYLSEKSTLDGSAVPMGSFTMNQPLAEMESYQQVQRLKVPLKPLGKYYVLVKTDANEQLAETSEADNVKASPIELLQTNNLVAGPDRHVFSLNPTEALQGRFDLGNLSSQTLTGLSAVVQGAPANVSVQLSLPQSLNSLQVAPASFSVVAADESVLKASPTVTIRSAEGEQAVITLDLTVIQRKPVLTVSPVSLDAGMVRGKQETVECEITNSGSVAATGLIVDIPAATWLSLTTPPQPADIPPGGKAKIGLALRPSATQALGPYTGQVLLRGSGISLPISFRFVCASEAKGDLKIIAEDEYTYFAEAKPPVVGAKVKVTNAATGAIVAEGTTDAAGAFAALNVPEGAYNLEATAAQHSTHRSTVDVEPGRLKQARAFLPREIVSYSWTVVPVPTEDRYTVTLETVFETRVPAPVVTVDPAFVDARKLSYGPDGTAVVNYTLTNHGFIAAQDVTFTPRGNNMVALRPAVERVGTIPALSTVVIPVVFTRLQTAKGANQDCWAEIVECHIYICDIFRSYCVGTGILTAVDCGGGGPGGGGPLPGGGGPGGPSVTDPPSHGRNIDCDCYYDGLGMAAFKCALGFMGPIGSAIGCGWDLGEGLASCVGACYINGVFTDQCLDACLISTREVLWSCAVGWIPGKRFLDCLYELYKLIDKCTVAAGGGVSGKGAPGKGGGGTRRLEPGQCDLTCAAAYVVETAQRMQTMGAVLDLWLGDEVWHMLPVEERATAKSWLQALSQSMANASDGGGVITDAERATLLALPLPGSVGAQKAARAIDRWNRTMDYWRHRIYRRSQVPAGQSTDFIDADEMKRACDDMAAAAAADRRDGFTRVGESFVSAWTYLQSLLPPVRSSSGKR